MPGNGQCPPHGLGFQASERKRLTARQGRRECGIKLVAGVPPSSDAVGGRRGSSVTSKQGRHPPAREMEQS
ncbi:hypothetical protein PoB_005366300 [Plakobranchus ocellatus]|uniref:Uncharacterized protein n=1 Tax=Plakobranchus ocellatus TaxID=259542 RepID=A0AAV4C5J2_9GAST|nr:hypothetical protein PoB_005366300 [Plakobranchus ocellatus]